ncbi:MAG: ABC transporter ATP-binding protein [Microthrixaceae bacterium]
MTSEVIGLRGVTVRFNVGRRNEFAALRDADLSILAGETMGIVGPSGSGKSTLLSVAGLLRRPVSGEVLVEGRSTAALSRKASTACRAQMFGLVTQRGDLFPHWTALENVIFPNRACGVTIDRGEASDLLNSLGLDERVQSSLPEMLSGGERQRVAIARAIAGRPRVLFADEPTSALDSEAAEGVLRVLESTRSASTTVVVVTHDEALVRRLGARLVRVADGSVVSEG